MMEIWHLYLLFIYEATVCCCCSRQIDVFLSKFNERLMKPTYRGRKSAETFDFNFKSIKWNEVWNTAKVLHWKPIL